MIVHQGIVAFGGCASNDLRERCCAGISDTLVSLGYGEADDTSMPQDS